MCFEDDLSLYTSYLNCKTTFFHCLRVNSESGGSREKSILFFFYFATPTVVERHPQSCSLPPLCSTSKLGATVHPWPESQLVETSIISWHWQHSSDSDQPRAWPKKQKKPTKVVIFPQEEMHANIASTSSWLRNTSVSILRIDSGCFSPPLVTPVPESIYQKTEDKS